MITTSQVSQWEIDIKYFRDQLESLRAENSTLRELLWQALEDERSNISDHGPDWRDRAEKALEGK